MNRGREKERKRTRRYCERGAKKMDNEMLEGRREESGPGNIGRDKKGEILENIINDKKRKRIYQEKTTEEILEIR